MRCTIQFVLFLVATANVMACEDAWCTACLYGRDDDWCDETCVKGEAKCKAMGGESGGGKDGKSDKEMGGKGGAIPACLDAPAGGKPSCMLGEAGSFTTSYRTTYDITKASNGTFTDDPYPIVGFVPDGTGPFPLFMWFPGTYECVEAAQYQAQQMANRGFVAVAVQYPYDPYDMFEEKAAAVAGANEDTALSVMCAHEKVDCSAGVAVGGYSQGTHIAVLAAKISGHIKAAYLVAGTRPSALGSYDLLDDVNIGSDISKTKRRYITGEGDQYFAVNFTEMNGCPSSAQAMRNLMLASGYDCGSETNCLQSDGSGFYVTTTADTCGVKPDHYNWMDAVQGVAAPWFKPIDDASFDWLQSATFSTGAAKNWTTVSCSGKTKKGGKAKSTKKRKSSKDTKKSKTSRKSRKSKKSGRKSRKSKR